MLVGIEHRDLRKVYNVAATACPPWRLRIRRGAGQREKNSRNLYRFAHGISLRVRRGNLGCWTMGGKSTTVGDSPHVSVQRAGSVDGEHELGAGRVSGYWRGAAAPEPRLTLTAREICSSTAHILASTRKRGRAPSCSTFKLTDRAANGRDFPRICSVCRCPRHDA